ncbi:Hpt domain-containing protein [Pseudomonas putida]|uniref:Histidine kinase n=1 Tax=Pseudomonas putida TaxID=303 RepID=A0A177SQV8_PSEPU|nr:Hpt domain-containing protein [Pseudomonas putida]OAI93159.1 histidine kinase [Pseudomonas putida]
MSDSHVDRKVLSDLQDVMGDDYLKLLETFLYDSERRLNDLFRARNADELRLAAHSFKGSASNMGAHELAELCRQVEERVQQHSLFGIEHLIVLIRREFAEVHDIFRDECKRVQVS